MPTDDPLLTQVGGNHYTRMKIQPHEFTMPNGWDSCAHAILKYVHRHADKNGVEDLKKALHTCDLRGKLRQPTWQDRAFNVFNGVVVVNVNMLTRRDEDPRIPMERYIAANGIERVEADALLALDQWVACQKTHQEIYKMAVTDAIMAVIETRYGGTK